MKYLLSISYFLFTMQLTAQTIAASYAVAKTINYSDENGIENTVAVLKYDGFLYASNNIFTSFIKPLYLNDYPKGSIALPSKKDGQSNAYVVVMDTLQEIQYIAFDSLIMRYRFQKSPQGFHSNFMREFEANYQKWEILPEIKTLQGLQCQRAKLFHPKKAQLIFDVWFYADIPVQVNFSNIIGLPGLVIEGELIPEKIKFALKKYELDVPIPKQIFWPNEFNEPFKQEAKIYKRW